MAMLTQLSEKPWIWSFIGMFLVWLATLIAERFFYGGWAALQGGGERRPGRRGILANLAPEYRPKIVYTNTSNEYWRSGASLTHTDPLGQRDATLPANVRIYSFGGTQHGPSGYPPKAGRGQAPGHGIDQGGGVGELPAIDDQPLGDRVEGPVVDCRL